MNETEGELSWGNHGLLAGRDLYCLQRRYGDALTTSFERLNTKTLRCAATYTPEGSDCSDHAQPPECGTVVTYMKLRTYIQVL